MRRLVLIAAVALVGAGCTSDVSLALTDRAAASSADGDASSGGADPDSPTSTAATETATTTTTSTTTPARPITLGFAGDVQMLGSVVDRRPLDAVAELLSAPDLMFVNLETVVAEPGEVGRPPIDKPFIFRSPPGALDQLAAAGVDVVGLANNHAWDYGPSGAAATRMWVDASPLSGTGAGPGPEAAFAPVYLDVDGRVIGVVSLTRVPCDWSRQMSVERPEVAWACDRFAIAAVGAVAIAAEQSDVMVVLLHAGTEITDCPDHRLREVVEVLVEVGADVIAVSHPHVLQGVEIVDGSAVLWSTGNFAFQNGGGRTARSAIFEITLGDATRIEEIRIVPTVLPGGVAAPADPDTARLILDEVSERSAGGRLDGDGVWFADDRPSICD